MKHLTTGVLGGALVCTVALSLAAPMPARAAATSSTFDLGAALSIPELSAVRVDTSGVQLTNADATPSDLSATYQAPYTAYVTMLDNDLPWATSLVSQSDTVTLTDTTTTTVETGITNIGGATATVGFSAGFFNASVNAKWEVQSSSKFTDTTTATKSHTWVVPGQTVPVPAYTKVLVRAEMQNATFSGKLKLKGDLTGNVTFTNGCGETFALPVGKVLSLRRNDGTVVTPASVVPDGDVARFAGSASFSGVAGTYMKVRVTLPDGATQPTPTKSVPAPTATATTPAAAPSSPVAPQEASAATAVDASGVTTFTALADKLKCGSTASTAAHSYVLDADGRASFVANGVTVVSPTSTKFTSLTGDSDRGISYALATATDGSVWITWDNHQMTRVNLSSRALATAGHSYALTEDGRISFVANGVTVVSPTSLKFTSVTGQAVNGASYAVGIATDGSVWTTRDNNQMTKVALPVRAKATAGHGYVLAEDGGVWFVADGKIAKVSPASAAFTAVSADWAQGSNYALAVATDGTVWMTQNDNQMRQIPLSGRAKATAGHGFVLGEDGRLTYVAAFWWNGATTVVSPSSVTFRSVTGDWENNNVGLAVASDGTVWAARDASTMRQITLTSVSK